MHAVFSNRVEKVRQSAGTPNSSTMSEQISRVVALQNQVIRGLVDADALGYAPARGAPDETEGISEETSF
jgi:hypothetical protein